MFAPFKFGDSSSWSRIGPIGDQADRGMSRLRIVPQGFAKKLMNQSKCQAGQSPFGWVSYPIRSNDPCAVASALEKPGPC